MEDESKREKEKQLARKRGEMEREKKLTIRPASLLTHSSGLAAAEEVVNMRGKSLSNWNK